MKGHVTSYDTKAGRRWSIFYDLPPTLDPDTGETKRRQRQRRGFTRKRDAESALRKAIGSVEEARHVDHRTDTLGGYLVVWLEGLSLKPTTVAQYRQQVRRRILPHDVAAKRLQDVTTEDLDRLYRHLETKGSVSGGPLSPKSVRHTHGVLRKALGDARRRGHVFRNVAEDASPPKLRRTELDVWSATELRKFLASVERDRLYALWLLYATTGMRRGEALGLRWSDVDLEAGTLTVQRNRTVADGKVVVQDTKTDQGRRRIGLDPATVAALRRHRVHQLEERVAASVAWQDTDAVFAWFDGRELHPKQVTKWFNQHIASAGLPPIRLHDVRHSYATVALSNREPITVVSKRLGHAKVSITLDVYSHILPTDDGETASRVASIILGA
jgi:integrase